MAGGRGGGSRRASPDDRPALQLQPDPDPWSVRHQPRQGKFTLQLLLREGLQVQGLKVAQVGTEHQSRLFGMDDCFPCGHINNVTLSRYDWAEYFDLRYRQVVRDRSPDIIIVGSQGGVIPYRIGANPEHFLHSLGLHYLMAARADSYILVVNHLDEPQFIQDTMDALRIIGKGRTILLALSTRKKVAQLFGRRVVSAEYVDRDEQTHHVRRLEDRFDIPVVSILDEGVSDGRRRRERLLLRTRESCG